jgi:hypothetical protein
MPHAMPNPVMKSLKIIIIGDTSPTALSLKKTEKENGKVNRKIITKKATG